MKEQILKYLQDIRLVDPHTKTLTITMDDGTVFDLVNVIHDFVDEILQDSVKSHSVGQSTVRPMMIWTDPRNEPNGGVVDCTIDNGGHDLEYPDCEECNCRCHMDDDNEISCEQDCD